MIIDVCENCFVNRVTYSTRMHLAMTFTERQSLENKTHNCQHLTTGSRGIWEENLEIRLMTSIEIHWNRALILQSLRISCVL